ncbi:hypothetical protein BsWGS_11321 [Bradybaena similaris]
MWQLLQRLARTPVLNVVRRAGTHERPDLDLRTKVTAHLKKHPEVLPILGIIAFSTSWAIYHIFHAATSKGDVRFNKSRREMAPYEEIGPTQRTKMYNMHPENGIPTSDVKAIRNDIAKDDVPKRP